MANTTTIDPALVSQIVSRCVAHNAIPAAELPNLIATVHRSLAELGQPAEAPVPLRPAIAVNRSYAQSFVVCLDCGWRGQMLRRHLTATHGLSSDDYRARWNLKATHPLTAPGYSERRATLAKQFGLGRGRQPSESVPGVTAAPPATTAAQTGLDPAFAASLSQPKRRGRPRRIPAT
jgi:predicted transcriptional regulator